MITLLLLNNLKQQKRERTSNIASGCIKLTGRPTFISQFIFLRIILPFNLSQGSFMVLPGF